MEAYTDVFGRPSGWGTHLASISASGKAPTGSLSRSSEKNTAWPRERFADPMA